MMLACHGNGAVQMMAQTAGTTGAKQQALKPIAPVFLYLLCKHHMVFFLRMSTKLHFNFLQL
jgi:hypothetical protein